MKKISLFSVVVVKHLAHSLGASSTKNALNRSEHLGQKYENTEVDFLHLGGSYPSKDIYNQAKPLFENVATKYGCVSGDVVCQGIPILRDIGLGMIGNNPTTVDGGKLGGLEAHSEGNQNISNLRFVDKEKKLKNKIKILKSIYPNGIRKLNDVNNVKKK